MKNKENRLMIYCIVVFVLWGMLIISYSTLSWRNKMFNNETVQELKDEIVILKENCEALEKQISLIRGE